LIDRCEAFLDAVELIEDVLLDVLGERGVGASDQVAQDGDEWGVLGSEAF
jgi:hypothetical protein